MPSWSYSHVEEERDDRVHTLVPTTGMDLTGALCANAVKYSSMYTGAATPAANTEPLPTRTTARLTALNGVKVEVGVAVAAEVDVGVDVNVMDGVRAEVPVCDDVCVSVGAAVLVGEDVTVDSGVSLDDGLLPRDREAELVCDELAVALVVPVDEADGVLVMVLDPVVEGVQLAHTGGAAYGAAVTPRNTVLVGAVASTALTPFTVSYEYSLVADERYSM